jgi:hypothetical protein
MRMKESCPEKPSEVAGLSKAGEKSSDCKMSDQENPIDIIHSSFLDIERHLLDLVGIKFVKDKSTGGYTIIGGRFVNSGLAKNKLYMKFFISMYIFTVNFFSCDPASVIKFDIASYKKIAFNCLDNLQNANASKFCDELIDYHRKFYKENPPLMPVYNNYTHPFLISFSIILRRGSVKRYLDYCMQNTCYGVQRHPDQLNRLANNIAEVTGLQNPSAEVNTSLLSLTIVYLPTCSAGGAKIPVRWVDYSKYNMQECFNVLFKKVKEKLLQGITKLRFDVYDVDDTLIDSYKDANAVISPQQLDRHHCKVTSTTDVSAAIVASNCFPTREREISDHVKVLKKNGINVAHLTLGSLVNKVDLVKYFNKELIKNFPQASIQWRLYDDCLSYLYRKSFIDGQPVKPQLSNSWLYKLFIVALSIPERAVGSNYLESILESVVEQSDVLFFDANKPLLYFNRSEVVAAEQLVMSSIKASKKSIKGILRQFLKQSHNPHAVAKEIKVKLGGSYTRALKTFCQYFSFELRLSGGSSLVVATPLGFINHSEKCEIWNGKDLFFKSSDLKRKPVDASQLSDAKRPCPDSGGSNSSGSNSSAKCSLATSSIVLIPSSSIATLPSFSEGNLKLA